MPGIVKPGPTEGIPYARKALNGPNAATYTREAHVSVDNRIGGARTRAQAAIAFSADRTGHSTAAFRRPRLHHKVVAMAETSCMPSPRSWLFS
ncbi:MAG: MspA family porin [Segniliparus sp.]|uniref:MspA family porin n=1 Tax=Segniliparus sp. TaxID=2804064 RepID=UPI003F32D5A3